MRTKRPNIVLIMCDQLRYDCVGYAQPDYHGFAAASRTPCLDQLATRSIVFDQAYCASPICSPARGSWLTGTLPHAHHQLMNYSSQRRHDFGYAMRKDAVTLGDVLKQAGYACGIAGPWHLGDDETPQHGFTDMWRTVKYLPAEMDAYHQYLIAHDKLDAWKEDCRASFFRSGDSTPARTARVPIEHQRTTWTINQTIDFAREQASVDQPFFAFASVKDPHPPILPPAEVMQHFSAADAPLSSTWLDPLEGKPPSVRADMRRSTARFNEAACRHINAHYLALTSHVDAQVGRLMDALEEISADTIVCFISDHGEMLGELGMYSKTFMYEGSVRVPWLLHWPAGLPNGYRVNTPVSGMDLMPTVLDLAGLSCPSPIDGRSLAGPLRSGAEPAAQPVFAEIADRGYLNRENSDPAYLAGTIMVRDDDWKYIRHRLEDDELYNLRDDPMELNNVVDNPQLVAHYRKMIAEMVTHTGPGPYDWAREAD